jgi:hypothetical protein
VVHGNSPLDEKSSIEGGDSAYNALESEEMDAHPHQESVATAPMRRIVRTWVGQFSLVGGQAQEQGPCLGLFQGNRADGDPVDLFVLVEPTNPASEQYAQQIIDAIADLIQQEQLSMTGALVRSVQAAHETLLDWNRKSLREHQVGVGISCLAIRHEFAYLAQAGPCLANIWNGESLEEVTPLLDEAAKPLGSDGQFYPEVRRIELHDGTMLLLSSPALADLLDQRSLAEVFKHGPEEAVMDLYARTRHLSDFSLVVVAATAEHVPVVEDPAVGPPPAFEQAPQANGMVSMPTIPESSAPAPLPPEPEPSFPGRVAPSIPQEHIVPVGPQRVFPSPMNRPPVEGPPDIDDYANSGAVFGAEFYEEDDPASPGIAYAPPPERRPDENLAQRMRRFFGVSEEPEVEDFQSQPAHAEVSPPEHAVLSDSGPAPLSTPSRGSYSYRNIQRLPSIGLEPDWWQMIIDQLARLGWPVLGIGALIVLSLLVGAWCVVLR